MAKAHKLFVDIEVDVWKLERARYLIKDLRNLGLSKKTLNLLIKDIYKKQDEIREIRAVEE